MTVSEVVGTRLLVVVDCATVDDIVSVSATVVETEGAPDAGRCDVETIALDLVDVLDSGVVILDSVEVVVELVVIGRGTAVEVEVTYVVDGDDVGTVGRVELNAGSAGAVEIEFVDERTGDVIIDLVVLGGSVVGAAELFVVATD